MLKSNVVIFFVTIFLFVRIFDGAKTPKNQNIKNFGLYDLEINSFAQCRGPKKENISESSYIIIKKGNNIFVHGNKTNKETVGPAKARIRLLKWNGKRFENMVTYRTECACEFTLLTKYVWNRFNRFDSKCNVIKGTYALEEIDLKEITRHLSSDRYFYGKYSINVFFFHKNYNIECIDVMVTYLPKSSV